MTPIIVLPTITIRRDLLSKLAFDISFTQHEILRDRVSIPMKELDSIQDCQGTHELMLTVNESTLICDASTCRKCILDAIINAPDIFQERMSNLMTDLNFVQTYLNDLLVITTGSFVDHLNHVQIVRQHLSDAGLRINADKSTFCVHEIKHLECWITPTKESIP
jgi:Reverse transcriptase (RNA-dependent DNA polymerase)